MSSRQGARRSMIVMAEPRTTVSSRTWLRAGRGGHRGMLSPSARALVQCRAAPCCRAADLAPSATDAFAVPLTARGMGPGLGGRAPVRWLLGGRAFLLGNWMALRKVKREG